MRDAALAAIGLYQRYLSPHKGFCCAYRAHTGRASCSALGARVIRRWGVWRGLGVLKLRLRRCGEVSRREGPLRMHAQRGVCDPGCDLDLGAADGCDGCKGRGWTSLCDCGNCGACDWPSRRRKDKARYVRIPAGRWPTEGDRRRER